jgi:hypothetical protein
MDHHQSIAATCEQTVTAVSHTLAAYGYRVERSFDLRSALHDQPDCPCPHHGATQCTCQYMVLLAYEPAPGAPPAVITAHECDGITRVRVASEPGGRLSWSLLAALAEALTSVAADV